MARGVKYLEELSTIASHLSTISAQLDITLSAEFRARIHKALSTDAIDDRVIVPHNDLLNIASGNKITIEVWAYPIGWQKGYNVGVLIDKRSENTANYNWEFNDKIMAMRIHAKGKLWIVNVPHSLFRWNHYVMVLDGSWLGGYLNGKLKAERNDVPPSNGNTVDLHIGEHIVGAYKAKSLIAIVRFYREALSKSEVRHLYRNPFDPPLDYLVLWLEPGSIDLANGKWWDLSGKGNHGIVYGATETKVVKPDVVVL